MNKLVLALIALALPVTNIHSTQSQDEYVRSRMIGDLEFIKNSFYTNYSFIEWKEIYCDWDLEGEVAKVKDLLINRETFTTKDFHTILKRLFHSAKDYHVSISFYSTESATLPFLVQGASDRYFFTYVDEWAGRDFPFCKGDELLAIDGEPVQSVIARLIQDEIGSNYSPTDKMLAEIALTTRSGKEGNSVPKGKVKISGVKRGENKVIDYVLNWSYTEENISPLKTTLPTPNKSLLGIPFKAIKAPSSKKSKKLSQERLKHFCKDYSSAKYAGIKAARVQDDEEEATGFGTKKSLLPILGEVRWEAPKHYYFHAYLFYTPDESLAGYVRIPSYKFEDLDEAVKQFEEIITFFEKISDVMVIDQLNNPGGYLTLAYAFASMLTTRPLEVPEQRRLITQSDVYFAYDMLDFFQSIETEDEVINAFGDTFHGVKMTMTLFESLKNGLQETIDTWNKGRTVTDFTYEYGIREIEPHPEARYTKPIVCLINSLDMSGGDFFPAILQDNKRAIIMGTRTAGAGGYITSVEFPNLSGIESFNLTGSIARRKNKILIENFGVTPDIWYEPSVIDLQWNYIEYKQELLRILDNI